MWNYSHLAPFSRTGKMPVKRRVNFIVEQAGKPVHKKLIEYGATSQIIDLDSIVPIQPETIGLLVRAIENKKGRSKLVFKLILLSLSSRFNSN